MEKRVGSANFESFATVNYKEWTQYQHTTAEEFHIFSAKSTLLEISHPF